MSRKIRQDFPSASRETPVRARERARAYARVSRVRVSCACGACAFVCARSTNGRCVERAGRVSLRGRGTVSLSIKLFRNSKITICVRRTYRIRQALPKEELRIFYIYTCTYNILVNICAGDTEVKNASLFESLGYKCSSFRN